jgi:outer membrane protein assembly factor BamB
MTANVETLELALTALGHMAPEGAVDEGLHDLPDELAPVAVLARRGWVEWFDLEDDFHVDGAHSELIGRLLERCGVVGARILDAWVPSEGRCVEVRLGDARHGFLAPTEIRSDWGELDLLRSVARHFAAARDRSILAVETDDQTVCLVCVPNDVRGAVETALPIVDEDGDVSRAAHAVSLDELDALFAAARAAVDELRQTAKRAEAPRLASPPPLPSQGEELRFGGTSGTNVRRAPAHLAPPLAVAMLNERVTSGLPVISRGRMFVVVSDADGSREGLVARALREETGAVLWERPLPSNRKHWESHCLLVGDDALICAVEGTTWVLDPESGDVLACHERVLPYVSTGLLIGTDMLALGPRSHEPSDTGHALHLFSPRDNELRWSAPIAHFEELAAAAGDRVVVSPTRTSIAALDMRTGHQTWGLDVGALGVHMDIVSGEDVPGVPIALAIFDAERAPFVVVGIETNTLVALDLATGAQRWRCKVPIRRPRFEASADGTLHMLGYGDGAHRYCRVAAESGALLQSHDLSTWMRGRSPLFRGLAPSEAHVFFSSGEELHAMRLDDGIVEWTARLAPPSVQDKKTDISNANHSEPAIVNGRLHIVTMKCTLHTFARAR